MEHTNNDTKAVDGLPIFGSAGDFHKGLIRTFVIDRPADESIAGGAEARGDNNTNNNQHARDDTRI